MIVSLKRTRSRDNVFAILSERSLKTTNKRSTTWNFTEEAEGAGRKEESACIKLFGPANNTVFITLSKIQAVYKYFYRPSNVEEKLRTEIR
tara:strand:+ start:902 stop:1174 length:273 start_codon:yes stop_codon:yes gene_type:complete